MNHCQTRRYQTEWEKKKTQSIDSNIDHGFSAKDFNTAIIKMLQQAIMSTRKTSEKKVSAKKKYIKNNRGKF